MAGAHSRRSGLPGFIFGLLGLLGLGRARNSVGTLKGAAGPDRRWREEDYRSPAERHDAVVDPWDPVQSRSRHDRPGHCPTADHAAAQSVDTIDSQSGAPVHNEFRVDDDTVVGEGFNETQRADIASNGIAEPGSVDRGTDEVPAGVEGVPPEQPSDDESAGEERAHHEGQAQPVDAGEEAGGLFDKYEGEEELDDADETTCDRLAALVESDDFAELLDGAEDEAVHASAGDEAFDLGWGEQAFDTAGFESFEVAADAWGAADHEQDIPDYDPEARQSPWGEDQREDDPALRGARAKAGHLVSLLEFERLSQRDWARRYLTEIFEHLNHPATFRALRELCTEGLEFRFLRTMIELRSAWGQRTEWWRYRAYGEIKQNPRGYSAMTWRLARRVCLAREEYPPDAMIDEEWLDEWLALSPGATGYISFPEYVGAKVDHLDAEALDDGLRSIVEPWEFDELGDNYQTAGRLGSRLGLPGPIYGSYDPYLTEGREST